MVGGWASDDWLNDDSWAHQDAPPKPEPIKYPEDEEDE